MVVEKSRGIAIITAMGGTTRTIMAVFMLQGLAIGLVGTILETCWAVGQFGTLTPSRFFALKRRSMRSPTFPLS